MIFRLFNMAGPSSETQTFKVENINKHRINCDTLVCEFNVKWSGWDKKDNTWEPLENVKNVPLMLRNMQLRSRAKILKTAGGLSDEAAKSIPNFSKIPSDILNKMKAASDPLEFVPEGTEEFRRVICQVWKPELNLMMWKVQFAGFSSSVWVRKDVVTYYWPEDAALYASHAEHKEQCFKRYLESTSEVVDMKKVRKL